MIIVTFPIRHPTNSELQSEIETCEVIETLPLRYDSIAEGGSTRGNDNLISREAFSPNLMGQDGDAMSRELSKRLEGS